MIDKVGAQSTLPQINGMGMKAAPTEIARRQHVGPAEGMRSLLDR